MGRKFLTLISTTYDKYKLWVVFIQVEQKLPAAQWNFISSSSPTKPSKSVLVNPPTIWNGFGEGAVYVQEEEREVKICCVNGNAYTNETFLLDTTLCKWKWR